MKKADLVTLISEKVGIPKVDVILTMDAMFKEVRNSVIKGESVFLRGFGTFYAKKRAAKIGRVVKKNIAFPIAEHYIPGFKPAKLFHTAVKTKCKKVVKG